MFKIYFNLIILFLTDQLKIKNGERLYGILAFTISTGMGIKMVFFYLGIQFSYLIVPWINDCD